MRLTAQEDKVELPVYGATDPVAGVVEFTKPEGVTSVEVKVGQYCVFKTLFLI